METGRPLAKQRCKAMIDAGIEDPESQTGVLFCAGNRDVQSKCPYKYCVVMEHRISTRQFHALSRKQMAIDLRARGVSVDDIVLILRAELQQVRKYLK